MQRLPPAHIADEGGPSGSSVLAQGDLHFDSAPSRSSMLALSAGVTRPRIGVSTYSSWSSPSTVSVSRRPRRGSMLISADGGASRISSRRSRNCRRHRVKRRQPQIPEMRVPQGRSADVYRPRHDHFLPVHEREGAIHLAVESAKGVCRLDPPGVRGNRRWVRGAHE